VENEGSMITDWLDQYGDPEIEKIVNDKIMKDEFRRMQELAGVPVTSPKTDLKENFVGMGAINNPFANREKTDYELAFERYSNTLNEEKPSSDLTKKEKSAVVKKARAGKDIGEKGKGFEKVAKAAGGGEKGKKIAAAAMWRNIKEEEEGENPIDTIIMDVPLFIRMLEYAREDASTDMDLHDVAEKATELSAQGEPLTMENYNDLISQETLPAEID
jgi:hypothetical protein